MKYKLVFVTSHPIQYQVPVFRELTALPGIQLTVLFAMLPDPQQQGKGFGTEFEWDIPLRDGYDHRVLNNVSKHPGVTHFRGCDTPGIFAELKKVKPDAVLVNGWGVMTCLQTLWACKRLGIPCLVRGESNDLRLRPVWKRVLQRLLVNQYAACLYIGEENRRFYRARSVPDKRLFPACYCIDNQRFTAAAEQLTSRRDLLRSGWGIPSGAACYLFCGKFEAKKHPLNLLQACLAARSSGAQFTVLMVGDGALKPACEAFALRHDLPVTFTGFLNQSQIVKAYVAADCLVLPSDTGETWGLVVNEAMACGLPALVSDQVGCAADLVHPGETGAVFRFGDWDNLASLLTHYSNNLKAIQDLGTRARQLVAAYSPRAAAEGMVVAVSRVLGCQA